MVSTEVFDINEMSDDIELENYKGLICPLLSFKEGTDWMGCLKDRCEGWSMKRECCDYLHPRSK